MTKKTTIGKFILLLVILFSIIPLTASGYPTHMKSDDSFLYVAHHDGIIEVWDRHSGSLEESFESLPQDFRLWSFETDGTNFYVISYDEKVRVFDREGRSLRDIELDLETSTLVIDKGSPQFLYIGSYDKGIRVWNTDEWHLEKTTGEDSLSVGSLTFDDLYIYSGGHESVMVWDKQTMSLVKNLTKDIYLQTLEIPEKREIILEMRVLSDRVYTGSSKGKIGIWDLTTDSLVKEIDAHTDGIKGLVTDGQYLYSAGNRPDKEVKIWTLDGEPAKEDLKTERSTTALIVDENYIYVGIYYGGVVMYDKDDLKIVREFGNLTDIPPESSEEQERGQVESPESNPTMLVIFAFVLFLVIVVVLEVYVNTKRKHGKMTKRGFADSLTSFVSIEDILKILILSSIIIFAIGTVNTLSVFPNYVFGLQAIYYFDILVKRGAFLPIWFLLLPSLGYWITKKHKRKMRYFAALIALVIAVIVYVVVPTV